MGVANELAHTLSTVIRIAPNRTHGAYFLRYDTDNLADLITTFAVILDEHNYTHAGAAILARGTPLAYQLSGGRDGFGQGATRLFAEATVNRDVRGDMALAFDRALGGMLRLFAVSDIGLRARVVSGLRDAVARSLRRCVWKFLRDSATGVPEGSLAGDKWHAELKKRLPSALAEIETVCGLVKRASWSMNVNTRGLGTDPLVQVSLVAATGHDIRVSTVHKVKGESIRTVLYVTNPKSLSCLLTGTGDEEGRIGYVALTRASDLLILAIPKSTKAEKTKELMAKRFNEWPS